MADLTDALLTIIQNHRIDGLELGPDSIHPAYDGLSILNFPSSLCRWFGADSLPHPPLDIPALNDLTDSIDFRGGLMEAQMGCNPLSRRESSPL